MKSFQEIKDFADREYKNFLKSYFRGVDCFPLKHKSFGKYERSELQKNFDRISKEVEILIQNSKEQIGYGYEIIWDTNTSRSVGKNNFPRTIEFPSLEDYLKFISKEKEFFILKEDSQLLLNKFPELNDWFLDNPTKLIEISDDLEKILEICSFFKKNPKPNLYIRELPIYGIHSKFIEKNETILKVFLDKILNKEDIKQMEKNFENRYYLKTIPKTIRFRILDKKINYLFQESVTDISLTFEEFQTINFPERNLVCVENQINYLTFPNLENAIIVLGMGYNIVKLKELNNLKEKNIFYWGDFDSHGFDILSKLRECLPGTKSLFMNREVWDNFADLATDSDAVVKHVPQCLSQDELELFNYVNSRKKGNRLEQERIPMEYIRNKLKSGLS